MAAGGSFIVIITGLPGAVGRNALDQISVVVNLERAAAGLLQIEQLELLAVGQKIYSFVRRAGAHADAAQTIDSVAGSAHQTVGMPPVRRPGADIFAAISVPRTAGEGISAAAVAEFFLEAGAQV